MNKTELQVAQSQQQSKEDLIATLNLAIEAGKRIDQLANSIVYQNALVSRELKSTVATQLSQLNLCLQLSNPTEDNVDEGNKTKTNPRV